MCIFGLNVFYIVIERIQNFQGPKSTSALTLGSGFSSISLTELLGFLDATFLYTTWIASDSGN